MRAPRTPRDRLLAAILASGVLASGAGAATYPAAAGADVAVAADVASRQPRFTYSARITNPWLPFSAQRRVELRGVKDGRQVRSARTRLERTTAFAVGGDSVQA